MAQPAPTPLLAHLPRTEMSMAKRSASERVYLGRGNPVTARQHCSRGHPRQQDCKCFTMPSKRIGAGMPSSDTGATLPFRSPPAPRPSFPTRALITLFPLLQTGHSQQGPMPPGPGPCPLPSALMPPHCRRCPTHRRGNSLWGPRQSMESSGSSVNRCCPYSVLLGCPHSPVKLSLNSSLLGHPSGFFTLTSRRSDTPGCGLENHAHLHQGSWPWV